MAIQFKRPHSCLKKGGLSVYYYHIIIEFLMRENNLKKLDTIVYWFLAYKVGGISAYFYKSVTVFMGRIFIK